jgi:hypothetical protein
VREFKSHTLAREAAVGWCAGVELWSRALFLLTIDSDLGIPRCN